MEYYKRHFMKPEQWAEHDLHLNSSTDTLGSITVNAL
mgnify:CR=1 FL=1